MIHHYHCEAYDKNEKRIGGFVVTGETMGEALTKAGKNIEVVLRPDQFCIKVSQLDKRD